MRPQILDRIRAVSYSLRMPVVFELRRPRCPLWVIGAVVLASQVLSLLSIAAATYVALEGASWLLGIDLLQEEFQLILLIMPCVWAPIATGRVISSMSTRMVMFYVSDDSTPEEIDRAYAHAQALAELYMREERTDFGSLAALAMVTIGILAANLAPLVLLIEFIEWLTSSEWPGLTLADGLALFGIVQDIPETDSQRLIDLALAVPLSLSLFAVGLFLCIAGFNLGDRTVRRQLAERSAHE